MFCAICTLSFVHADDYWFRTHDNFPFEPFSLQRGSEIPSELLERLTTRAELNRTMAKRFTCTEEIDRDNSGIKVFDYLLEETSTNPPAFAKSVEPSRFKGEGKHQANFSDSVPPAFAWTYLFDDTYQANFTYRYLGQTVEGYRPAHRIAFRGIRRFDRGTDIREWEGIAIVDAETHEIMRIEAAPRNFAPIVKHQRRKYQMAFKFIAWRLAKKPRVRVLHVDFRETSIGVHPSHSLVGHPRREEDGVMSLPRSILWQEYVMNASGRFVRKRTEERRYSDYRFFDVDAGKPELRSFAKD